jgi:hypothetical protein
MTTMSISCRAAVAMPRQGVSRRQDPLVHLAVAAVVVGIVAVELLLIGATMPAMLFGAV